MEELAVAPAPYRAPSRLRADVVRTERTSAVGWPVAEIRPRTHGRAQSAARVLFLHGGAYFREIRPWHWRFAAGLAAAVPAVVTVPVYPLTPVATASDVVPVVLDLAAALLATGGPVVLVGDSAGAGLALAVAQELRARSAPTPSALVLVSPWLDISVTDPAVAARAPLDPWLQPPGLAEAGRAYRGELPAEHPWVSPIHGRLDGLGRVLVLTGTADILNADARRLVERAAEGGQVIELLEEPGLLHDYVLQPTPEGRRARRGVAAWVRRVAT